jgi:hypothetical protein
MPEKDGYLEIINEGPAATAGQVVDLLPKLADGTYAELKLTLEDR